MQILPFLILVSLIVLNATLVVGEENLKLWSRADLRQVQSVQAPGRLGRIRAWIVRLDAWPVRFGALGVGVERRQADSPWVVRQLEEQKKNFKALVAAQATITGAAVVVGTLDVFSLPKGLSAAISIIAVVLFGEILPKTYALNRHRNHKALGPWAPSVVLLWLLSRRWLLLSPALAWIVETIAVFTLLKRDS